MCNKLVFYAYESTDCLSILSYAVIFVVIRNRLKFMISSILSVQGDLVSKVTSLLKY